MIVKLLRRFPWLLAGVGIVACRGGGGGTVPTEDLLDSEPGGSWKAAAVAPRVLVLTVRSQEVEKGLRGPYLPEEGDVLEDGTKTTPAWTPNGIRVVAKETRLLREGAHLYQPFPDFIPHLWQERIVGEAVDTAALDDPGNFRLASPRVLHAPLAVHRKSTVHDGNDLTGEKVLEHRVYLVFEDALEDGVTYALVYKGEKRLTYTHAPRLAESEAIHVNQIGYRADDPFKRAFFSVWMGTGGGLDPAFVERFEILDADSGETVYAGTPSGGFPANRPEGFSTERNLVGADVLYLDFHDFARPGNYRIHVPGVGVSLPFTVGEATWARAFRTAMHGFLSHRSGIELGPPFSDYHRPRNMHPDDGFRVFAIPYTMLEGEAAIIRQAIMEKLESGVAVEEWETVPDAWGGYMDAGDWDRRSQHLTASRDLAELFSLNPDFFTEFPLALPPNEAHDSLPDLLNEVIWNVDFYRRLQMPDGGVRGGIESSEHPRPGEASWEESLVLAAFAPDPFSTFSYASAAALLAEVLAPYDAEQAEMFADSARRAWDWAETHAERILSEAEGRAAALSSNGSRSFSRERAEGLVRRMRFVASGALYGLTNEQAYHEVFQDLIMQSGDDSDEMGAYFRYLRLAEERTAVPARTTARERLLSAAERALEFGRNNAFGLHTPSPGLPIMGYAGFYSVPEMVAGPVLPRAYMLTGDERYLRGAVQAAHFSAGANPLNRTFTTGVGHDYPRNPLHIDSRVTGQAPPDGITIYGPMDAGADFRFNEWVHQWHLDEMVPGSRTWPAAEWHVDLFRWPAMSEYTIHQTFRPVAYYWGFLAARKER